MTLEMQVLHIPLIDFNLYNKKMVIFPIKNMVKIPMKHYWTF